jgi:acyl carrier protein
MNNIEIYKKSFIESLSISEEIINDNLEYNSIPEWDSIAHMGLISELEDKFKITFETDDIIDFSSFQKGKEILKKYKIEI